MEKDWMIIFGKKNGNFRTGCWCRVALCEGLAPMHKLNLVHRVFKPKNIIITNEGSLKIIDFDISRKENENAPTTQLC